ncbi:MAG TPA: protein kinase [Candidatus Acidoferrales bacterium]|nr:protein kinase [Candidatus Acidoferrales bacterium]
MKPDPWSRVEQVFHLALEVEESQRAAFLEQTCAGDGELRSEVEALLAADKKAEAFLESPALEVIGQAPGMPSRDGSGAEEDRLPGSTVSHYRILEKLGGGGMGIVYRAQDLRLNRFVALKFLPQEAPHDASLVEQLRREARAASALNHPHICTVHDIDEQDGRPFIVMELLEGQTLKHRIADGPLESKEIINVGIQIGEALEAAHARDIIHRDIKPANIFVTPRGQVKLLDFGLAKSLPADTALTLTENFAETRAFVGTLPYMAPEQLQGRGVSARTDIFAMGTVLYELATGRRPFPEEFAPELAQSILHKQPPRPRELNPAIPPRLESIILKCLEKDPQNRYQRAQELLQDLRSFPPPSAIPAFLTRWTFLVPLTAVVAAMAIVAGLWLQKTEYFWRNPIGDARFQTVTDFDGAEQAAAISRDGHFVAFLSDRDGPTDVWVTQLGSGQFHNLTRGSAPGLANPSLRALGFSPDSSLVTFWFRKQDAAGSSDISVWAVPTLGGQPKPYLEGVAEYDWSRDGSRLAYHTPGPGDPLFVSDSTQRSDIRPVFTAPAGLHAHFQLWAPDSSFIYFVQGALPDKLDIWRISPAGGTPERITSHTSRVIYPVLLDRRTLLYLASDPDGSGPWLYSMNVERRIPHRLTQGLDRYTSLAASADGRRLVATLATPKKTLWRLPIADSLAPTDVSAPTRISLTTSTGSSPRLGPKYLLYVSATGTGESIRKLSNETTTELWSGHGAQIFGGPVISPDGSAIAFSVRQQGRTFLYLMQADGTGARVVANSLDLQGAPAWAPDGQSITSAANDHGVPHLFRVPLDGRSPALFVQEYSVDPAWAPDGRFIVYSGPDIGTTFSLKAVTAEGAARPLPALTLTRGARRLAFLPGGRALVFLRGGIQHKNLWVIDLETGTERQITKLSPDFDVGDFDISPDGREVVLERVQERSDVVLLDLPQL